MRRILVIASLLAFQGCANHLYGNFAKQADSASNVVMVSDSVTQLIKLYPPARTRLVLQQETTDRYGQSLVRALRQQGYAVQEYSGAGTEPLPRKSTPLAYVIDSPEATSSVFRLTLRVGRQSLTRAYAARPDGIYPAGVWTRKD